VSRGFNVDLSQIAGLQRDIREWGENVKDEVAMAGVAAGARVLYHEAQANAPVSDEAHTFYGRASVRTGVTYTFAPGNLRNSIYRKFSPEYSGPSRKEYRISWNHLKAPYGHMVEFGTSRAAPHSFIGAALSALPEAYTSAKVAMGAQLVTIQRR
jgi:HK97 gp10 family phage protein